MTQMSRILVGLLVAATTGAHAQPYPNRNITFVVPFAPGPATDQLARVLARYVAEELRQSVVVENKPGANGFIGVQAVANAAPDGYTVLITSSSTHVLNTHLFKQVPYDPVKDFVPLTPLGAGTLVMAVNASSPYKSVADLIQAATRSPGKITVGSHSSVTRLAGELFQQLAGLQMLTVPYKALPVSVTDLIGGQIDVLFPAVEFAAPHFRAGTLRPLGVTGKRRMSDLLPDVPTIEEAGVKNYEMTFWNAAYLPARTPPAIAERMRELLLNAAGKPDAVKFFPRNAFEPFFLKSDEFARFQNQELEKWGEVFRKAGIKPE